MGNEDFRRLICGCGKKLRVPTNAPIRASKGKCPACNASFHFIEGQWLLTENAEVKENVDPNSENSANKSVFAQPKAESFPGFRSHDVLPGDGNIIASNGDSAPPSFIDTGLPRHVKSLSPELVTPESPADVDSDTPQLDKSTNCVTRVTSKNDELPNEKQTPVGPISEHELATETSNEQIQSKIRSTISRTLQLGDRYNSAKAAAIALACHPWPDESVGQNILNAIAAELLPACNINHPSIQEIAADRLLRIAEALSFEYADELLLRFTEAAGVLTGESDTARSNADVFTHHVPYQGLIPSPWGLTKPFAEQQHLILIESNSSVEDIRGCDQWQPLIHGLLGGAYVHGARDVGVICGGSSANVTVEALADYLGVVLPEKAFDRFLNGLSSRELDILKTRSYKLRNPNTLEEVAMRWDVSRERVRQIETNTVEHIRNQFADVFKNIGGQALSPFQDRVARESDLHGIVLAIAERSQFREVLAALLLELFGPWSVKGGWAVHRSIADEIASLQEKLASDADQYGFIDGERIETLCEHLFFDSEERNQYLTEVVGLGFSLGNWTCKQTLLCEVASAIKKIGRPATKEELADLLGHPVQRVGSIIGNIEGVMRADRYRWGFSEWIADPYDGIVGEIEQRIDAYNGSVPVNILLTEIPSQFGVAEGSVRAYLASSAFVVENDMVRRANDEEYVARHPETCSDSLRIGNRWAYKTLIYDRHFNGYSLGVNFDIAFANGLRPGDDLVVPIEGHDYDVSLIWRSHNLNRLVDVGRVSNFLASEGYHAGDAVIILPSRESVKLFRESEYKEQISKNDTNTVGKVAGLDGHRDRSKFSDPLLDLLGDL